MIDILIADDHALFREGLRKLLASEPDMRIASEAVNGEDAIVLVTQLKPQILLLDLSLPRMAGLVALRELRKLGATTRTIVLTADISGDQIVRALQLGAYGVVLKQSPIQVLVNSIRSVASGQYWVSQESVSGLVQTLQGMAVEPSSQSFGKTHDFGLTSREREVIALIGEGYTNKDLAKKLGMTEKTAKHHLTNIFDKLGVDNRLELVLFATEHQLGADPLSRV